MISHDLVISNTGTNLRIMTSDGGIIQQLRTAMWTNLAVDDSVPLLYASLKVSYTWHLTFLIKLLLLTWYDCSIPVACRFSIIVFAAPSVAAVHFDTQSLAPTSLSLLQYANAVIRIALLIRMHPVQRSDFFTNNCLLKQLHLTINLLFPINTTYLDPFHPSSSLLP